MFRHMPRSYSPQAGAMTDQIDPGNEQERAQARRIRHAVPGGRLADRRERTADERERAADRTTP